MLFPHDITVDRRDNDEAQDATYGQPTTSLSYTEVYAGRGRVSRNKVRMGRLTRGDVRITDAYFVFFPSGVATFLEGDRITWGTIVGTVESVSFDRSPFYIELQAQLVSTT